MKCFWSASWKQLSVLQVVKDRVCLRALEKMLHQLMDSKEQERFSRSTLQLPDIIADGASNCVKHFLLSPGFTYESSYRKSPQSILSCQSKNRSVNDETWTVSFPQRLQQTVHPNLSKRLKEVKLCAFRTLLFLDLFSGGWMKVTQHWEVTWMCLHRSEEGLHGQRRPKTKQEGRVVGGEVSAGVFNA